MGLERDLARWVDAGLVDAATAERILSHERRTSRPAWQWAVAALGLLSVGLGLLLLVAANWDEIPDLAKLAGHLLLTVIAAAGVAFFARSGAQSGRTSFGEGALFLLACLLLAGLALQAQIYQLAGPAWQLLLAGLLLAGPALLLFGRTWLAGAAFALLALLAALLFLLDSPELAQLGATARFPLESLALATPLLLLALGVLPGAIPAQGMKGMLRAFPLWLLGIAAFQISPLLWWFEVGPDTALRTARLLLVPLPAAALALWLNRRSRQLPPPVLLALLGAVAAALVLPLLVPHPEDALWGRLLGLAVTLTSLGWVSHAAGAAGWRWLFHLAVGLAALRIFAAYFELFGSLATTGLGMVGGGLLLMALAWGWRRVTRTKDGAS